jgi:cysteine-rich repeat protein
LSASYCGNAPAAPFSGTIDLFTGHFVIAQPPNSCYIVEPPFCLFDATATLNGLSWSGTMHCSFPHFPGGPVGTCDNVSQPTTAAREYCGDGYAYGPGEQCDDGNTTSGDCCSSTCQYEPAGSACSDGNPSTCDVCTSSGYCQGLVCPIVLDHYKCYQGSDLGAPPFSKRTVSTSDQISAEPVLAQRLKYVCTPVDKNGEGINDPAAHLACYQVKGARLDPRPRAQLSSQFQISQFELKKPQLLCVPATKTVLP